MLLGFGTGVDEQTLEDCIGLEWFSEEIVNEQTIWEIIRRYLKDSGKRKYYNKIPWIVGKMGYEVLHGYTWNKYCYMLVRRNV